MRPPHLALLLLAGCAGPGSGPTPLVSGDGFFDHPFPSDLRTVDGHPDLAGFPGRADYDLVDLYASDIEGLDGFGTNAPIWVRFDGELDTAALPGPADSMSPDAPILLIDIDPDSPQRGERVPWTWAWADQDTTFQSARLLSILPLAGRPLRPAHTYAVVVRTDIARPAAGFPQVFDPGDPEHAAYADLGDTLFELGIDTADVAVATVFTTQDPLVQLRPLVEYVRSTVSTPPLDQVVQRSNHAAFYDAYDGQLWLPLWQHGDKPYVDQGGGFEFQADGTPLLGAWERATFTVSIPSGQDMPAGGWPVVLFMDGTGSDHSTFADGPDPKEPAAVLGRRGIAGISISLPLHGERGTGADPELITFNYFNPTAARGNFQQGVLDIVFMVQLLGAGPQTLALRDDDGNDAGTAVLAPSRIAFAGHSQGGILGAMAAPFLGGRVKGALLSGAGGGLSLSIVYRKEGGLDIQQLISQAFGMQDDEAVTPDHPLIGMVQTLGEAVDPLNFAPYWSQRAAGWDAAPIAVLQTTGTDDPYTPSLTSQVLAAAGGLPILDPVVEYPDVSEIDGLVGQAVPCQDNVTAWDGSQVSGGIAEFAGEDHFPIFTNSDAIALYGGFLQSALDGAPPLIDLEVQ